MSEGVIQNVNGTGLPDPFAGELDRIRSAYAKRSGSSLYSFWDPAHLLSIQERERNLLQLLLASGFASRIGTAKILEIGCGSGAWLREFVRWGAQPENIVGIDLLPERVAVARRLCPNGINLTCQSASNLRTLPGPFDLILQSTLFTSILSRELKAQIAQEMLSVLDENGVIVWYDFHMNNPANRDVRGIDRGEIAGLFPGCNIDLQKITLAPPIGRFVAPISQTLYRALSIVKPLCTHYLGIIARA